MSTVARKTPIAKPRSMRSDGAQTRGHILQTAGRLFALKGYGRTTSKEVCEVARTNMAAVNYHFGGKVGLYAAVLVDAHAQLVQLAELEQIRHADQDHKQKVRALISLFVRRSANPELSWGVSVLAHELVASSRHVPALLQAAVLPKIQVMMDLIAEVLELPRDHAAVQRGLAFVVLPCIMLVIAPKEMLKNVLPALTSDAHTLTEDMTLYALAGLQAMKQAYRTARA